MEIGGRIMGRTGNLIKFFSGERKDSTAGNNDSKEIVMGII